MQGLYFVQWLLILVLPAGLINALQKMCLECQIKLTNFSTQSFEVPSK